MSLAVSCLLGPVLTYSSMLSTTYNSPLATAITGNTKDLAITFIGVLFLSFKFFLPFQKKTKDIEILSSFPRNTLTIFLQKQNTSNSPRRWVGASGKKNQAPRASMTSAQRAKIFLGSFSHS
jgi:hypothetical protein